MAIERGIILGPKFTYQNSGSSNGFMISPAADPTLLRHAVLYFDRIHWTQNSFMIGGIPSDIMLLHDAGIADARITKILDDGPCIVEEPWLDTLMRGGNYPNPQPVDMAAAYFQAQSETYLALEKAEPEVWTMGGHAPMWQAPAAVADSRLVSEIRINAALPTPPDDVPLAAVVEFRERYKKQFAELRSSIDGMCSEIDTSTTPLRAEAQVVQRIEAAIEEVRSVAKSGWLDRVKSAVKIDRVLSLTTVGKLMTAYGLSSAMPADTPLALKLAPFAFAADKVSLDFQQLLAPRGLSDANRSFAYLLSMATEFKGL